MFTTADGVSIAGLFTPAANARGAALLLHMMPAVKESWAAFSDLLAERGVASLAIDLRGHGESVSRGETTLDYRSFDDRGHQETRLDVEAAAGWLKSEKGFDEARLLLAGASIGANLALRYVSEHSGIPAVMALSPGLEYHGVSTADAVAAMNDKQALFLAASEDDAYSFETIEALARAAKSGTLKTKKLRNAGHGTTMFERDAAFMAEAADWLAGRL